jgi:hypothetical protein
MCHTHQIKLPWEEGRVYVPHPPDPTLLGGGWSLCATSTRSNSLGRSVESYCLTHLIQLPWEEGGVYVPQPPDPVALGGGGSLCATPT